MRQLIFRSTSLGTDRVRERPRQAFTGMVAIGVRTKVDLGSAQLRVLETDRRNYERVVRHLSAADLPRGGTTEEVCRGVVLSDRIYEVGILQNRRGAKHQDELGGLG